MFPGDIILLGGDHPNSFHITTVLLQYFNVAFTCLQVPLIQFTDVAGFFSMEYRAMPLLAQQTLFSHGCQVFHEMKMMKSATCQNC